ETETFYPADKCIHQLFEEQAALIPDDIAVVCQQEEVSYRELNVRANVLAHHLIGLGVGPETRVGVLMKRSVEMIVALLGVLKAGAAYLPIDPSAPPERIDFMLADAGVCVLLTHERLNEQLQSQPRHVLSLDSFSETGDPRDETNPSNGVIAGSA